jgi:hypothetical protein
MERRYTVGWGELMVKIKEMPFNEKYDGVINYTKVLESFALPLVKENLGDEKVAELKSIWQEESEPVPESGSYEEKYEVAFRNWVRKWQSAYIFASNQLGEGGAEKFEFAAIEENKRRTAGSELQMYRFVRAISRKSAFQTFAKQMAYKFQVFTQLSLSELTGQSAVMKMPHCKILDVEGGDDFCTVGCQKAFPVAVKDLFNVKVTYELKGKSCTATFAPL